MGTSNFVFLKKCCNKRKCRWTLLPFADEFKRPQRSHTKAWNSIKRKNTRFWLAASRLVHGVSALWLGSMRCQKSSRKKWQKQAKRWFAEKVIVRVGEPFRAIFSNWKIKRVTKERNEENILWVSAKVSLASRFALPHQKWINEVKRKWIPNIY